MGYLKISHRQFTDRGIKIPRSVNCQVTGNVRTVRTFLNRFHWRLNSPDLSTDHTMYVSLLSQVFFWGGGGGRKGT